METAITIIVSIIGSTAIASLVQFFVGRHDGKKKIPEKLETLERDGLRTQLLVLMSLKPQSKQEIMTLAQHYFADLHGDWYMTGLFNRWLEDNTEASPEWFNPEK